MHCSATSPCYLLSKLCSCSLGAAPPFACSSASAHTPCFCHLPIQLRSGSLSAAPRAARPPASTHPLPAPPKWHDPSHTSRPCLPHHKRSQPSTAPRAARPSASTRPLPAPPKPHNPGHVSRPCLPRRSGRDLAPRRLSPVHQRLHARRQPLHLPRAVERALDHHDNLMGS